MITLVKTGLFEGETMAQLWNKASEFYGVRCCTEICPGGVLINEDGDPIAVVAFESEPEADLWMKIRTEEYLRRTPHR